MTGATNKEYFSRLDALRAFSVLAVLVHHFFPHAVGKYTFIGNAGVDVFFVISGFLITGILLKNKESVASNGTSLKKFYIRRFFRIFPIYYLYLLFAAIFFWALCKDSMSWALTYTINIYAAHHQEPMFFAHLWSLSVEEQFYIFWPCFILFTPRKYLLHLIIGVIAIALIVKLSISSMNHKLFTVSCMDAFGAGALLAYSDQYNSGLADNIIKKYWILILAIIAYIGLIAGAMMNYNSFDVMQRTIIAVIGFFFVTYCVHPDRIKSRSWDRVMSNKTLIYIGRISYGIYIYHFMVRYMLDPVIDNTLRSLIGDSSPLKYIVYNSFVVKFPLYTAITILIAALSFRFIESPLTKLKDWLTT